MKWMHHRCLLAPPRLHERNARNMAKRGLQKKMSYLPDTFRQFSLEENLHFQKQRWKRNKKKAPKRCRFQKSKRTKKTSQNIFFGGENLKKDVSRFFFRNESEPYGKKTKKGDSDSLVICLALFVSATYLLLWRRCYASLASCNRTEHVKAHKNPLGSFPVPWYLRISPGRSSLRGPEKSGLCIF